MNKIVAFIAAALIAAPAAAQHPHFHHQHRSADWVGPAIIGIAIGAAISQPRGRHADYPVVVPSQPQVVVVPSQPQVVVVPSQPRYVMKSVDVYIEECGCTRTIRVPVPLHIPH